MKKTDCPVIRDLMPLVIDRAASEESRRLVEEHVEGCEACRNQYEAMKSALPEEARAAYEEEQRQMVTELQALKRVRCRRLKRRLIAAALAVVLCAVAAFGGMAVYYALFTDYSVPVDVSLYPLTLARLRDGRIVVTVDGSQMQFNVLAGVDRTEEDGRQILTISYTTTPIRNTMQNTMLWPKWVLTVLSKEPDEIRQGAPNNSVTLWRKGEPIPAASEEMETYMKMEASSIYWASESVPDLAEEKEPPAYLTPGALDEAREAVPEWQP